jgi:protein-S-isoprenylcysteine O-methyltransferase Ste14
MPHLALFLVAFWFLSLFVFRTALQWWRTGSTGIRGFSGRVGSLEWNAGLLASLGMAAGVAAPVATLAGWPGGSLWFSNDPIHWVGVALTVVGIVGALASQVGMGNSWRIGVDEKETTDLVTQGLFAWVRNPIFSFILVSGVGLFALLPNLFTFLALVSTLAGIEMQVRAVEEPYLEKTHGPAYRSYAARVGRFFPGRGRWAPVAGEGRRAVDGSHTPS